MERDPSSRPSIRTVVGLGLTLMMSGCMARAEGREDYSAYLQRLHRIADHSIPQTSWILDRHGTLLAEIVPEDGYRTWVPLQRIPRALRDAVVATEDRSFHDNPGIDRRAIARAVIQNSQAGQTISGASTITMQVVRLFAFEPDERMERSMDRKVREVYMAAELYERYSKDEILEAYLNAAAFGNHANGVEAAAQNYFSKHVWQLTLAECTLLAGLVQAPSALNPLTNPEGALRRQGVVLDSMVQAGMLSESLADVLRLTPVRLRPRLHAIPPRRAAHFVDHVTQVALPEAVGARLASAGGFTVTTTLDLPYHERLEAIARGQVERLRAAHDLSAAAVVALRPDSGEILGMVGGVDYDEPQSGQVNMATSPRQMGSTFKTIGYAAALEEGWTPATVLWDIPHAIPDGSTTYRPSNYDGRYRGPVRLRMALASSLNAAAIDVAATLGLETIHRQALRMGLPLKPDAGANYGVSLILGAGEVPLLDLTSAYAAIANRGVRVAPRAILRIQRPGEDRPMTLPAARVERVVGSHTAWLLSSILSDAQARRPAFGDGGPLNTSRPAAVKTGTTDDFRDNATVGFTPYLAIGVWTGNKDNRPMRNVMGITGAAPIWNAAMESAFADGELMSALGDGQVPTDGFAVPPGIVQADVCDLGTLAAGGGCRATLESFAEGTPTGDEGTNVAAWGGPCSAGEAPALLVLRPPWLADGVRAWSARAGYRLAPAGCDMRQSP